MQAYMFSCCYVSSTVIKENSSFWISICKDKSTLYSLYRGLANNGGLGDNRKGYIPAVIVFSSFWTRIECFKAYHPFKTFFQPKPAQHFCSMNFVTVCKYNFPLRHAQ